MTTVAEYKPKFAALEELRLEGAGFVNPRPDSEMNKAETKALADDIIERGLRDPLLVWEEDEKGEPPRDEDGKPILVVLSGKRRVAALRMAQEAGKANGLADQVPYRPFKGSLQEARFEAVLENLMRKNPSDYALAVQVVGFLESGLKQQYVAKKMHMSPSWVSRIQTAFKKAAEPVKQAWQDRLIPLETVQTIAEMKPERQEAELAAQLKARESGAKSEIGKARKKSKVKAGKNVGQSVKVPLASYLGDLEEIPRLKSFNKPQTEAYLMGMSDTLQLALGIIGEDKLAKPWKEHAKELAKSRAAATKAAPADDKDDDK